MNVVIYTHPELFEIIPIFRHNVCTMARSRFVRFASKVYTAKIYTVAEIYELTIYRKLQNIKQNAFPIPDANG